MLVGKIKKIIFHLQSDWLLTLTVLFFVSLIFILNPPTTGATLSCSIASVCNSPDVALINISATDNAHASIGTSTDYNTNIVCCINVSSLSSACNGTYGAIVNLSSTTNAHVETSSLSNYPIKACLHVATGGYVSSTVQSTNCTGYHTTVASMSTTTTNGHVGDSSAYIYKICASAAAPPQSLSFSISSSSIGFGNLSSVQTRYATNNQTASSTEIEANFISATTNAEFGYAISIRGATLSSGTTTIDAIGGTNTAPSIGANQFGIRSVASGGSGLVVAPYALSGFAYAANATTASVFAENNTSDSVTTNFSMRYMVNISPVLKPGSYSTALTFIVTAQY